MTKQTKEFDLTIVYRVGTAHEINGDTFDYVLCDTKEDYDDRLKGGWSKSTDDAVKRAKKAPKLKAIK